MGVWIEHARTHCITTLAGSMPLVHSVAVQCYAYSTSHSHLSAFQWVSAITFFVLGAALKDPGKQ